MVHCRSGCGYRVFGYLWIQLLHSSSFGIDTWRGNFVYAHYFRVESEGKLLSVSGEKEASETSRVEEVFIKSELGKNVRPPLRMGDRYGYVIAASEHKEEAKHIALEAAQKVRLEINPKTNER